MSALAWALVPVAYLIGTFPSATLIARANGVDIRRVGSGNPGASNVTRVLGWKRGIWVFVLDAAKGALAAGIGLVVADRPAGYVLGAVAVVGHVFPVWERFRGGKGVATGGGIAAVMVPIAFAALIALWFAISKLSGKASVASIVIVALLPVGVAIERRTWWEVVAIVVVCALVMARHTGNIARLVRGREHNLGT
ncbi:MAG TPA: glycerol-3-phosphate 1-O-acyltransferase PlsY [Ilumatobacter sp.]|nr:glycerol-3-phosphate 1-O-acyltransferase PlsY [Ilumatobacter sp.]